MLDPKDEIKERLDIVDVIREYVPLKAAGSNWKALCPFHQEKTPSFMVSPERQTWRCFGSCNEGGDVFSFVMKKEGMEFPEALRMFADKLGIELRRGDKTMQTKKTVVMDILDAACEWWHRQLLSDAGADARVYVKSRGITKEDAETWHIGFAPPEWDVLSRYVVERGFTLADILASGLVIPRERSSRDARLPFYDRFRGRIMFPIRDGRGVVVGAGGRIIAPDPERREGKYINTPETILYQKSRVLYGLDRAKAAMKESGIAVLVEGYMDVIASHRAGITNTVAVSGTALTQEHVTLVKRYATTVALSFDRDAAGQAASRRSVTTLLAAGCAVRVIRIPEGVKDPDECVQKDPDAWRSAVATAPPLFEYLFSEAQRRDLSRVEEKKVVARDLLPLIAGLPDPVEKGHYLKMLAGMLGIAETVLHEALSKASTRQATTREESPRGAPPSADRRAVLAERMMALLVCFPEHIPLVTPHIALEALPSGPLRDLYTDFTVLYHKNNDASDVATLLAARRTVVDRLSFVVERFFEGIESAGAREEVVQLMHALKRVMIQDELTRLASAVDGINNVTDRTTLLERVRTLTEQLQTLS